MSGQSIELSALEWRSEDVDALAHLWRTENQTYVIATVIDTGGSTPRLEGTRLVTNGTCFGGTIGGGAVEKLVIEKSQELLISSELCATVSVHLVRDLAMCCGGKMSVFLNKVKSQPSLVIFGAGHIGRALATMSAETQFGVSVVDDRPNWIAADNFGAKIHAINEDPAWFAKQSTDNQSTYYLIVTHSHDLDQNLVETLLKQPSKPAFIGLIGSRGKWARFQARLLAKGFSATDLERVHCPCGLNIGSETPGEIAVSVLAQLIQQHRNVTDVRVDS